jgi:hypothetical protein
VKLVIFPTEGRHVNVTESMQADRAVKSLRPDIVYDDSEALRSPEPVLHRQQLCVRCLAWNILEDVCHLLGRLSCALEVIKQPCTVRLREEDGAMILVLLRRHPERVIGQLVVSVVIGVYSEGVSTRPLLSIDNRVQYPG